MVDPTPSIHSGNLEERMDLLFTQTGQAVYRAVAASTNILNGTTG